MSVDGMEMRRVGRHMSGGDRTEHGIRLVGAYQLKIRSGESFIAREVLSGSQ